MATLLDIKARIKAVENIKKITRAMQLVAAAKFNRAQMRARSARPYSEELDGILGALASAADGDAEAGASTLEFSLVDGEAPLTIERARLFEQSDIKRPGIVLVTSDRGLCGAFNTRLVRSAVDFIKQNADKQCRLITVGRKGHTALKNRDVEIIHHVEGVNDKLSLDDVKRITHDLLKLYVTGEVDALYLVYAQFKSAMVSNIKIEQFLSIPPVEKKEKEDVYILEPDEDAVYETLIPLYATTKVFATLADSFASEHGARMTAMQTATKNAEEMLDDLVLTRNRLRQAIITRELSEIVGGSAASQQ